MVTRVSSVQLPFTYYSTPQEFADLARVPIEGAAESGADLIVLPHLASLMLFGMFDFGAKPGDTLDALATRQNTETAVWLGERAGYVHEFYLHMFQSLAARVERWLVPGTVLEPEGDSLYITAYLLNPVGEVVGRQRQLNLSPHAKEWGVTSGVTLRVLSTEIGDLGIVIGDDARHMEFGRVLAADGAGMLVYPEASGAGEFMQDLAGQLAQATRRPIIRANLVGTGLQGRSGIYAPDDDAWRALVEAQSESDGEILLADLEL